jgi:hypothetical protein
MADKQLLPIAGARLHSEDSNGHETHRVGLDDVGHALSTSILVNRDQQLAGRAGLVLLADSQLRNVFAIRFTFY